MVPATLDCLRAVIDLKMPRTSSHAAAMESRCVWWTKYDVVLLRIIDDKEKTLHPTAASLVWRRQPPKIASNRRFSPNVPKNHANQDEARNPSACCDLEPC